MATTLELIARVRDLIAEAAADYYSDAEILGYVNEGRSRMFGFLDVLPAAFTLEVVATQEAYDLTELVARWVWLNTSTTPLIPITAREFAMLKAAGTSSGTPTHYCPEFLKADGTTQLLFYPTPSTSDASGNPSVNGFYYAEPPLLVLAATGPPAVTAVNPAWHENYHFLPSYYAAGVLLRKDRLHETAEQMEGRFNAGVEEYRMWYERKFPLRFEATRPASEPAGRLSVDHPGVPWPVG